jgi:hypothetical protein
MAAFDVYYKWLAIPPAEQPPNLYRLLGLNIFEADPDVISIAADQRMAHIRSFQTGPHSDLSQAILNELASARVRLLTPEKKAAYDESLRLQVAMPPVMAVTPPLVSVTPPDVPLPQPIALKPLPPAIPAAQPPEAPAFAPQSAVPVVYPLQFMPRPELDLQCLIRQSPQSVVDPGPPAAPAPPTRSRPVAERERLSLLAVILLALMPVGAIALTILIASNSHLGEDESTGPSVASSANKDNRLLPRPADSRRDNAPIKKPRSDAGPLGTRDPDHGGQPGVKPPEPPKQPNDNANKPKDDQPGPLEIPPDDKFEPLPVAPPLEKKTTEPVTLAFDQDDVRIQVEVGDIPKDAQLQIEIIEPAKKVVESKAKVKTSQHLIFNESPRIEVVIEVLKIKPGVCLVKISAWLGNRTQGIPCNLTRMQQMSSNLPGQIQDAQAALESARNDLAAWQSLLDRLLSEVHGPPGADPGGQIQQQVAIREAKAKLTAIRGRVKALSHEIDRWTAQLNELPGDIQLVRSLVGTTIRYRLFYVANDGSEVEVGKK